MATLSTEQQSIARQWIADGMKLSDFQRRLETDFALKLTYMEVRFLIDDLKVVPKDPEPPKAPPAPAVPPAPSASAGAGTPPGEVVEPDDVLSPEGGASGGDVQVTVDAVTRPNAMVSGRVRFSDGKGAAWLIDNYGRPGLVADEKGYRPSQPDMMAFQAGLERELAKLGF
jgi:hypothetical protein